MMFLTIAAAAFTCSVIKVHDGDGPIWCRSGEKVRIAGVQAPDFESAAPCRRRNASRADYTCSNVQAKRSRTIVQQLVLGRSLSCEPVDKSYGRVVARCTLPDGRSLSCATIAAGATVRWASYWRKYRMGECR